ncbi:Site-specific recombinase XerD [Blastococcus aggregatus]|uniref:Site-specific recombinase XerD n=1 Tax=Blastococcus aggregatus TaxID=38502 RepID=A0A285VFB2_9ACTN|nr:tyrosine-type recombinase/integrase [Blastococcus aggregatus]SOC52814.1 Site-specific recombinase XerD [Blastococcus aggregatus]
MGRPPLPLGTSGKVLFATMPNGMVKARVKFRDHDGQVRLVSKTAASRAAAERALKVELTVRRSPGGTGALTAGTRVSALAEAWLAAEHGWSTGTERTYRSTVRTQVIPAFGRLCLREITPGTVNRALTRIAQRSGSGAAKTARACLSGMFALAIADGAVTSNPVRDAGARLTTTAKKAPRALSVEDARRLVELFHSSPRAAELDVADLVDWMLATGARIGEALALRTGKADGRPLLDLDAGTWEVNATTVRVPKQGMVVQPRTKTAAGWRIVAVPAFAVEMVRRRLASPRRPDTALVFPTPVSGTLRDPTNVSADLRQLFDGFECEACDGAGVRPVAGGRSARCTEGPWSWVTSHTFRKTVATRLDEAGFTPRQVADQLGHANPSMTLDVYFGRHVVSAEAARVLGR